MARRRRLVSTACRAVTTAVLSTAAVTMYAAPAGATVAVTPVSGGDAISALTAATGGNGNYTALTGPTIAEGSAGDITAGTVLIDSPAGFTFGPGPVTVSDVSGATGTGIITLATTPGACATASSSISVGVTPSQLSFAVCTASTDNTEKATLSFTGITVRPDTPAAGTSGQVTLDASSAAIAGISSLGTLTEVAGPTTKLVITGVPATGYVAGASTTPAVVTGDAVGNISTGYIGTASFTSSDPQATLPPPLTFNGESMLTVGGPLVFKTAGTQSLTATDATDVSVAGTVQSAVVPAGTSVLHVTGLASPATAGQALTATVSSFDAYGNPTPAYIGTVGFSSSDPRATLPAPYTFTAADAGQRQFPVTLGSVGSQSVTATDTPGGFAGTQSGIAVVPGPARDLSVTAFPGAAAGVADPVMVTAHDAYGNVATGYTGTVHFTSTDAKAALPGDSGFQASDGGTRTFGGVTFGTVGSQTVTATDTADATITGTSPAITVVPGAPATIDVQPSATSATAGSMTSVVVTVFDSYGNLATNFTGTVHLSSSDPKAALPGDYAFSTGFGGDNGTHTFVVSFETAGNQSVTVDDTATPATAGNSSAIAVSPGPATVLEMSVSPTVVTAGGEVTVDVTAKDAFGNIASAFPAAVALTTSDPHATVPASPSSSSGGTATFTGVVLVTAGAQSITVTSGALTQTATGILVQPAAAASFTVSAPATSTAGQAFTVSAIARDRYGNTATAYRGTVALTAPADPHFVAPSPYAFTAGDAGTHSFSVSLDTSGSQTVVVTDTSDSSVTGTSGAISVAPAPATHVVMTGVGTESTAGAPLSVTLTARDQFGNVAQGYTGTVLFTSTDTRALLPQPYTYTTGFGGDNGSHNFTMTLVSAGPQTVTATDIANWALNVTSPDVTVVAAGTAGFDVSGIPNPVNSESPASLTVSAVDAFNNPVSGYTGTIHVTSSDPLASLPPDYAFTPTDAGAHLFINSVVLVSGGTQSVTVSDTVDSNLTGAETDIHVVLSGSLSIGESQTGVQLAPVTLNGTTQFVPGQLNAVQIEDGRSNEPGWSVTATMTDLTASGLYDTHHTIPAGAVSWDPGANGGCHPVDLTGAGTPSALQTGVTAGPGGLNGPGTSGVALSSAVPASLCSAAPGSGLGLYIDTPAIQVRVDPWLAAGDYAGTLTITAS